MTKTWKESRPDVSLPGFSLPPLSCLHLESPKASLPVSPGQTLGCADSPAACQPPAPDTHPWTSNPLLPTCLWAAHLTSLPPPATGGSAPLQNHSLGKLLHDLLAQNQSNKVRKSPYKKAVLLLWFRYHSNADISSTDKPWLSSYTHCCMRTQKHLLYTDNKDIKVTTENILKVETPFP